MNKNELFYIMFKIETKFNDRLTTKRIFTQIEQNDKYDKSYKTIIVYNCQQWQIFRFADKNIFIYFVLKRFI